MSESRRSVNAVRTILASCQDCYRCVRACPVKAIAVTFGQAQIRIDRCIQCGNCIRACPQHAKVVIDSLTEVRSWAAADEKMAVSLAPSFAASFPGWRAAQMPAALRRLGFSIVSETAEGAALVSQKTMEAQAGGRGSVCTACPAVVSYVEKYKPEMIGVLIPVVSPMIAHAQMLRKRLGPDYKLVFIGPCAAKKQEALRPVYKGLIDAVLTFEELGAWLSEEKVDLRTLPQAEFDDVGEHAHARLYPLPGGMLRSCDIPNDGTSEEVLHISGADEVIGFFSESDWADGLRIVEPLFCAGGCVNGPAAGPGQPYARRQALVRYAREAARRHSEGILDADIDCATVFDGTAAIEQPEIDELKIARVLESTGKGDPRDQLNCGACGYSSCRENAIAVAQGMAEREMCMPYMRRLAVKRSDKIIETIPSGVVILDQNLNMLHMNPAFQKMFMCNNGILGRRISYLVNAEGFEKLAQGEAELYESIRGKYGIKYHELIYALREEQQYVGFYVDISKIQLDASQVDIIKRQTLEHAKELLDHQIRFAQEMAHFLGRNTGKSEELVSRIMKLYEEGQ